MSRPGALAALLVSGLGCQTQDEPSRAPAVPAIVVERAEGPLFTMTRTPTGCGGSTTITIDGDTAMLGPWRLAPGPAGGEITRDGTLTVRVADQPGRRSFLDPSGVPDRHAAFGGDGGTVSRADRYVTHTLTRTAPGTFTLVDTTDEGVRATITGTDDPELAITLVAPTDPVVGALVACLRFAATSPSPAKSP